MQSWRLFSLLLLFAATVVGADNFSVENPAEFQNALTTAQSNGENDTIQVQTCSGTGCTVVGSDSVYTLTSPLTYTAASGEGFSLTIDGVDSDTRILSGNSTVPILRIDTRGATGDGGALIVVQNMTFVNGNAVGTPSDGGALAITVNGAGVTVSGSVFLDNAADDDGGALFVRIEDLAEVPINIFDVTFDGNEARGIAGDGTGDGGAIHIGASTVAGAFITDADFFNNIAQGNGGAVEIEGLDPSDPLTARLTEVGFDDIQFTGNTAQGNGGGADVGANTFSARIAGFVDNTATNGGGVHVREGVFDFVLVNTGFAANAASGDGGGIYNARRDGTFLTITNNTIYGNSAVGRGGGAFITVGGSTGLGRIYNNIIYDNTDATAGRDIFVDNDPFSDIPASIQFVNNAITDLTGFPGASTEFGIASSAELTSGANIDEAPILPNITAIDPDPTQGAGSPTIDAGDNAAPLVPSVDFENEARPQDGDGDGTATVDIGMDEFVPGAVPSADLAVAKSASPAGPVTEGTQITYTIGVDNNGPDDATGVTLVDTLDDLLSFVSATPSQGAACTTAGTPVQVTCVLGAIAASGDATVSIVVATPDVADNTTVTNVATVSGDQADPVSTNDSASVDVIVLPSGPAQADLALTKIAAPSPVFSGGPELTYTLTVQNNGTDDATNVVLTDNLPMGDVDFVSASASGTGSCDTAPDMGGMLSCSLGDIADGSNVTVTIVVAPRIVTTAIDITNTASVTADEEDPDTANNSVSVITTVNPPQAVTSVNVTATPVEPSINERVTYQVVVSNDGPSDDTNVTLGVTLPEGTALVSVTIDSGSCTDDEGVISCDIGDLVAGATVTAEIVLTTPGEAAVLTLVATIGGDFSAPASDEQQISVIDTIDLIIEGVGGTGSLGWIALVALLTAAIARLRAVRSAAGMTLLTIAVAAFLVSTPSETLAQDWYVAGGIGQSSADYSSDDLVGDLSARGWSINSPSVDDEDTAWKIIVGMSFNEFFAIETGYVDLGEATTRFGATIPPNQVSSILNDTLAVHPSLGDGWILGGAARWPLPDSNFALTGRAGLFVWQADLEVEVVSGGSGRVEGDAEGNEPYFGVGVEWQLAPDWSVTLDWDRYKLDDWVDVPMLGVKFSF